MFVPISKEDIPISQQANYRENLEELRRFAESGLPCAEYMVPEGVSAPSRVACFRTAARRYNIPVDIKRRKNRVFFVRKED